MPTSTMFLNKVTVIDHARLDAYKITGNSYNLNVMVEGKVDESEQVVIDFSTVKKLIKQTVDDRETGYDHKLWIQVPANTPIVQDSYGHRLEYFEKHWYVDSPCVLRVPENAVKFIYPNKSVTEHIGDHIQRALEKEYPNSEIRIKALLDQEWNIPPTVRASSVIFPFSYVHGLKSSTSWGCQNIAHGHESFLAVHFRNKNDKDLKEGFVTDIFYPVVQELNESILIWKSNLLDSLRSLGYKTERGQWTMTLSEDTKTVVMDEETTIENIAAWVEREVCTDRIRKSLKEAGVDYFLVSEGLSKGAKISL